MKTRNVIIVTLLLLVGSFSVELLAQNSLNALVKKCETMEGINISTIRNRNKETKKLSQVVTSIRIDKENTALINEFVAAFDREKENADQEIENKTNGKITNIFYRFGKTSYSFSSNEDGSASLSVIVKEEDFTPSAKFYSND